MTRSTHSAEEIQLELERVAKRLSADSEDRRIFFELPTLIEADEDWPFEHNWDVIVQCTEGFEDFVARVVDDVAARWDLDSSVEGEDNDS